MAMNKSIKKKSLAMIDIGKVFKQTVKKLTSTPRQLSGLHRKMKSNKSARSRNGNKKRYHVIREGKMIVSSIATTMKHFIHTFALSLKKMPDA